MSRLLGEGDTWDQNLKQISPLSTSFYTPTMYVGAEGPLNLSPPPPKYEMAQLPPQILGRLNDCYKSQLIHFSRIKYFAQYNQYEN